MGKISKINGKSMDIYIYNIYIYGTYMEKVWKTMATMHNNVGLTDFDGDLLVIEWMFNEATNHLMGMEWELTGVWV
jgi:hypothetical protein